MTSFIKVPFASSGDKAAVPDTDAGGGVNMTQGYGQAYSLDPATDPSAKRIERDKMNWLFNRITQAINEIQSGGVAPFITSADNGGSAFSYGKGALVSLGGVVYQSLVASNTSTPPGANWSALPEKMQPLDGTLTALAALVGTENTFPYFNGNDSAALAKLTSVGRSVISRDSIGELITYLGLDQTVQSAAGSLQINMDGKDIRDPAEFRKSLNLGNSATLNTGTGNGDVVTGSRLTAVINGLNLGSASRVDVGTGGSDVPNNTTVSAALTALLPKRTFTDKDFIRIPDAPGGIIIQWGRFATQLAANTSGNITLPTPFPNGGLFAMAFYSGDSGLQSTFNALVGSGSVKVFNTHPTNAATPFVLAFGY